MKKYGLIGKTLSHSFSKKYFTDKFDSDSINAVYSNFELNDINEFKGLLNDGIDGFNVTIPYKKAIIPFLDRIDPVAAAVQAVNTIRVVNRYSVGYNTDVVGFEKSVRDIPLPFRLDKSKVLVLGSGGASMAVQYVMNKLGSVCTIVSRTRGHLDYAQLANKSLADYDMIINTTPLGMAPSIGRCPPINYSELHAKQFVYDLIYNPKKTLFLKHAQDHGAMIKNGEEMLILQAEASWEIWNNESEIITP